MKRCVACAKSSDEPADEDRRRGFPEDGTDWHGHTLRGDTCWRCHYAFFEHWGWMGFGPHGRGPGPLELTTKPPTEGES